MADEHTLVLSTRLDSLAELEAFLQSLADRYGWHEDSLFELNVAVEEIVVNVIRYGHTDNAVHQIEVSVSVEPECVVVTVEDDGVAFDPLQVPMADLSAPLEERAAGGLGLHLVRMLVADLTYTRHNGRNRLVMKKQMQGRS